MKTIKKLRERRAISPVIATVILVAVAITVAVGVSYWMSGIAGQYTSFEKIEIQSASCSGDKTAGWSTIINLKNSGTKTATLTHAFVNDVEIIGFAELQIESGVSSSVTIAIIGPHATLSSGTTVNIRIHSAAGMDYIKLVQLT